MVQGVFRVYRDQADLEAGAALPSGEVPDLRTFVRDMHHLCAMIADGPLKETHTFIYKEILIQRLSLMTQFSFISHLLVKA